jgi:hypothetical protein
MHLQQTKRASAATGGPQYYFHSLTAPVKKFIRAKGAVPVALVTPYGATKSDFFAVSKDHKLDHNYKPVPGSVGHDRIQQGMANASMGEAIRHWYKLPNGQFERIDIEIEIIDNAFYIRPMKCKYAGSTSVKSIEKVERPLTFTREYMSPFWRKQLKKIAKNDLEWLLWSLAEMSRIVRDHRPKTKIPHIQETDLLRASGPLNLLGAALGAYVGKGYDCVSVFEFSIYPPYTVPVEVKRESHGFHYQQQKYGKDELSRAVILCALHNHKSLPPNIDVIELEAFDMYRNGKHSFPNV